MVPHAQPSAAVPADAPGAPTFLAGGRRKEPTNGSAAGTRKGSEYTNVYETGAMDMSAGPTMSSFE